MERGRNQVLYHFMPEAVVDYSTTGAIGKVERCLGRKIGNVDMVRLIEAIQRQSGRFVRKAGLPTTNWVPDDFVLLEPTEVQLQLFPLTFFCKNRGCNAAIQFRNIEDFRDRTQRYNYKCPYCRTGELEQTDFVHYHTCGRLDTLLVRPCPTHGVRDIYLDRNNSSSPRDWLWRCKHPSHGGNDLMVAKVGAHCFDHTPSEFMPHRPFRTSDVYYPESVALVDVPPLGTKIPDERIWTAVLGEYLGMMEAGNANKLATPNSAASGGLDREEARNRLKAGGVPEEEIDNTLRLLGLPAGGGEIDGSLDAVRQRIQLRGPSLSRSASKVYEYLQITSGEETKALAQIIREAEGPQAERVRSVPQLMNDLGFADAFVTTGFPLLKAVFGYSRGDPDRQVSTLCAFPRNPDFPSKIPIYGALTEVEAIVISLNRRAVHEWLRENALISDAPIVDETQLKAWFINNVNLDAIPPYDEVPSAHTTTKWVYRLTHSLAHILLRQAASIAGVNRDSLGELLFPNIPAFAIYTNSSEDFSLGGMYTLFENSLESWLEAATDAVRFCLNDPVCIEGNKACFACMHLAEVSCEHFNRELGRDTLIGAPSGTPAIGYWSRV
jgi:hypothetical protein